MKLPFLRSSSHTTTPSFPLGVLCFAFSSLAHDDPGATCRSNATHIAWKEADLSQTVVGAAVRRSIEDTATITPAQRCVYQNIAQAKQEAYHYLRENIMPFDDPFLETLGFHDDPDDENAVDGLDQGMIGQTIVYAIKAKQEFAYTDALPKAIWQEYVLNYANTNEARSNWRPLLYQKLRHLVTGNGMDIAAVVHAVNANMWKLLAPAGTDSIVFKAGQTPLIFDPMSIMTFGYASCTGCSILLVNALRTLGVPARLAGTAAWWQDPSKGNHNWVEVYREDGKWYFLEPSPGVDDVDDLDRPPRQRWFCQPDRFGPFAHNTTLVYAARLTRGSGMVYPLAWEPGNMDVPGEDVSAYYRNACGVEESLS